MPSIRQYEYFITLARTLHFSRAADELGVAQPALSGQLRAMELELGLKLFDRDRRNVELSIGGALLLPDAEALINRYNRIKDLGERVARGEAGSLVLSYVGSAALGGVMSKIIHDFRDFAPNVQLSLDEMDMDKQLAEIARGHVDGGFVRLPLPQSAKDLEVVTIQDEDIYLALRCDHPLANEDEVDLAALKAEPFIVTHLKPHMGFAACINLACAEKGFSPISNQKTPQLATIVNLVAAGLGVALVPASMLRFALPEVVYKPLKNTKQRSSIALVSARSNQKETMRKFFRLASEWQEHKLKPKGN